jgi:hypothetical protein
MTEPRKPARPGYDAVVDLAVIPDIGDYPVAYALIKFTHTLKAGSCRLAPPEPLFHNIRDQTLKPRLRQGTDYWPWKEATDFVVIGSAFAPDASPVRTMTVSARVGATTKRIQVSGTRVVEWAGGEVAWVPPPEPFTEMPLTYENAYGGIDWRVGPWKPGETPGYPWGIEVDHPGLYPRNPFGKGYVVLPGDVPGTEMPNLEDPDDLLSIERIVTRDPKAWYRQPLPWCFDWLHLMTFPRFVFFQSGVDAWFPGPQDSGMPEVRRGLCPANYRDAMAARREPQPHPRLYQEASLGLIVKDLRGNEPVVLKGMNPAEPAIRFDLPAPLRSLEFEIEGKREAAKARLHSVVCRPAEQIVTMLYAGECRLPRPFVPGIHKHIPVAVRVNGDVPVWFDTPQTVREQVDAAKAKPQLPFPWEKAT